MNILFCIGKEGIRKAKDKNNTFSKKKTNKQNLPQSHLEWLTCPDFEFIEWAVYLWQLKKI